ncbi:hypothetical protein [Pareuzebyella sediminis]|uniref:hypothetical protein n=1 Tax=Pareuzebyella sediminis TaxID=2607998 RepID=UPI0011EDF553|nr:hypothetical protein [Pareuzebyella sediminis]
MNKLGALFSLLVLIFFSTSCNEDRYKRNAEEAERDIEEIESAIQDSDNLLGPGIVDSFDKIAKATFYIENSESMFGYVNGFTEYVDVLSELSEKPMFAAENTHREFYFINGGENLEIIPIGDDPALLKDKLNTSGFRCGDYTKSNLNSMFQVALENAKRETISILISDAIYDIGGVGAPMNALSTEGRETRSEFITRLEQGDLQTIMIKLHSQFDGYYFPVSGGKIKINQIRPFYIWIFGNTELLNKYFSEEYIESLEGYSDLARFLKFEGLNIPYQATSQKSLGRFRFDRSNKNKLIDVTPGRSGQGFQFSFAADYSQLPFSDTYFKNVDNYTCSNDYQVIEVTEILKKTPGITTFKPTHLITVSNSKNPYGTLDITLKNVVPDWIETTNTDVESNIQENTTQTFGFKFLTEAISEAFAFQNKEKNVTKFSFEITK